MPVKKWTKQHRERFQATMAAKRAANGVKRSPLPPVAATYYELRGGKLRKLRVREGAVVLLQR